MILFKLMMLSIKQ